ncbi:P-type DNA transfer ATPase VirB11 [Burkholderia pyrrocinia]|uniref:P-type DNA transfer ATPase VirB11 n=1 Tax=Burkholderia pyrrocinia TaxID=60550 RepID=UPI00201B8F64|nr:P-type DNA transfer ATPase VirB11 [Burkholderia pyrrocinia]
MPEIAQLLAMDGITELVINDAGRALTETETGWLVHEVRELTHERLEAIAVAVATFTSQGISAHRPILSALLPDDERIQIVVPPAVPARRISFTIRKPTSSIIELPVYEARGVFEGTVWRRPAGLDRVWNALSPVDRELVELLEAKRFVEFFIQAVRERKNIVPVGDTGSGKTTFTKSLSLHIGTTERVVTIEDVRELFLGHLQNVVNLLYSKGGQGQAKVTPADLIACSMRMKPDRVLLAELRGAEAFDFLKLMTTGHEGSLCTYHARSPAVALERFALMAKEHPEAQSYDDAALKRLLMLTVDVIAHLEAKPVYDEYGLQTGKKRRMTEIWFDPVKKLEASYA